jgi:hypothetical protein
LLLTADGSLLAGGKVIATEFVGQISSSYHACHGRISLVLLNTQLVGYSNYSGIATSGRVDSENRILDLPLLTTQAVPCHAESFR